MAHDKFPLGEISASLLSFLHRYIPRSSSPTPLQPKERPLRTKKSHRRLTASPPAPGSSGPTNGNEGAKEGGGAESQAGEAGLTQTQTQESEPSTIKVASSDSTKKDSVPKTEPDDSTTVAPGTAPAAASGSAEATDTVSGQAAKENGTDLSAKAFEIFSAHLRDAVLPTDPHGEAELKAEFEGNYEAYARKKWGELPAGEQARFEREANGPKKSRVSKGEDVEMKDADD